MLLLACDVGSLVQQASSSPTALVQELPSPTVLVQSNVVTPTATTTRTPAASVTTPTVPSTTRTSSTSSAAAAPIPPGWQLVKYSKDESCTVAVPPDWKVDARISSALKTDASFTNGTVSVALASATDWNSFKTKQINASAVPSKVIENSATRLWFDIVGDGKTIQTGAIGSTVAVLGPNGKICMSILGTDGKAAASWRDLFNQIAQTVAFR